MFFQLATRLCRNGQWTGTQPICSKNSNAFLLKISLCRIKKSRPWIGEKIFIFDHFTFYCSILFDATSYRTRSPLGIARASNIRVRLNSAIPLLHGLCHRWISTSKMLGNRWSSQLVSQKLLNALHWSSFNLNFCLISIDLIRINLIFIFIQHILIIIYQFRYGPDINCEPRTCGK